MVHSPTKKTATKKVRKRRPLGITPRDYKHFDFALPAGRIPNNKAYDFLVNVGYGTKGERRCNIAFGKYFVRAGLVFKTMAMGVRSNGPHKEVVIVFDQPYFKSDNVQIPSAKGRMKRFNTCRIVEKFLKSFELPQPKPTELLSYHCSVTPADGDNITQPKTFVLKITDTLKAKK
jgi:hypothetical protein